MFAAASPRPRVPRDAWACGPSAAWRLMFDITAREGLGPAKIERFATRLRRLEGARGPLSEQEKLVAIADESVQRLARHREERCARRMVIATGSGPARGRWWDLGRDYANLDAPWES